MEKKLNAEQIKKALEKVEDTYIYLYNGADGLWHEVRYSHILALINSQEQRIKELTEENEKLARNLKIANLQIECKERILESYMLQYGTVADKEVFLKKERADTVREMQERLCEGRVSNDNVVIVANQIAKEMLEGE